jgi:polysaccharide biosynthesis/export protein
MNVRFVPIVFGLCWALCAQQPAPPAVAPGAAAPAPGVPDAQTAVSQPQAPAPLAGDGYLLGAQDELTLSSFEVEELSGKPAQIDTQGYLSLPLIGRVRAAGLSTRQLEDALSVSYSKYVQHPRVSVTITAFRSQPVSVLGAVNTPGVHYLRGQFTLIQALSAAGGLRQDAGNTVRITRRREYGRLPLPAAADDSSGQFSVAEIELNSIMQATNPRENILVMAQDVITVPRGQFIYVIGEVAKPGGFVLSERKDLAVLEALALAGGVLNTAAKGKSRILRSTGGASRKEEPIDLKRILAGQAADVRLGPDDMLFIPSSASKKTAIRVAEAALQSATGIIIWRGGATRY